MMALSEMSRRPDYAEKLASTAPAKAPQIVTSLQEFTRPERQGRVKTKRLTYCRGASAVWPQENALATKNCCTSARATPDPQLSSNSAISSEAGPAEPADVFRPFAPESRVVRKGTFRHSDD
jgi:hypothetical protein